MKINYSLYLITFAFYLNNMDKPEMILVLKNQMEATLLDDILNERNIPHIMRSYHDLAYDGLWATDTAWGEVDAPSAFREEIRDIYNNMSA